VRFCRGYHRRSLATARLQAELTRAQLQTMKAQLQPHFLFNTLNTISVLITENPAKANRMILLLSDLLRQTLETSQADEVTLKRELELLRAYVEIQRMRFRRRLSVSYDVNADILEAKIPHFALQPIVENAIRHGIAKQRTGGRIDIRAHRVGGRLVLQVQDNGPGLSVESLRERNGNGIGLANTRKRLSCIYGSSSSIKIESGKPNGTVATIVIPFRESGKQS
jgi:two-component system LytT family sensor kinase